MAPIDGSPSSSSSARRFNGPPKSFSYSSLSPDPIQLVEATTSQTSISTGTDRHVRKLSLGRFPARRPSIELESPGSYSCGQTPHLHSRFSGCQPTRQRVHGPEKSTVPTTRDMAVSPFQKIQGHPVHSPPPRVLPTTPDAVTHLPELSPVHHSSDLGFKGDGFVPNDGMPRWRRLPTSDQQSPKQRPSPLVRHMGPPDVPHQHIVRRLPSASRDLGLPLKGASLNPVYVSRGRIDGKQVNRPAISGPPPDQSASVLRPASQNSNISRRRMTPVRLSLPFQGDEMVDLEKFGSAWNNYLQNHARRSESLAHRISELEKLIADQKKTIHEYADRLKQQSSTISTLEDRVSELSDQNTILTRTNTEVRDELEQNDARRKEMQAKVKSYRAKLNEAIVEQQELYKRCKTLCDGAVDSIRKAKEESKSKQQAALEQFETGMNKATAARDAMRSLLEEELRVSQAYCEKVGEENTSLKEQVSHLTDELKEEKGKTQRLAEKIEHEQSTQDRLQCLESKSNEILAQLQEASSLIPFDEATCTVISSKLDALLEHATTTATNIPSIPEMRKGLVDLFSMLENTSTRLQEDVSTVLSGQDSMRSTSLSLEATIRDQLSLVNDLIKSQDERLLTKLSEKHDRCEELSVRLAEKDGELQLASTRVNEAASVAAEKSRLIQELDSKIKALEAVSDEKCKLNQENASLIKQLCNKEATTAELQLRLECALAQNESKSLELQNCLQEISEHMKANKGDSNDVSAMWEKMTLELESEKLKLRDTERAIQKYEGQKLTLERDLNEITAEKSKLSKELADMMASRDDENATLERTRKSLADAEQRIVNLKDRLKKSEFGKRDIREMLNRWAGSADGLGEIQGDILALDLDALRTVVRGMVAAHQESTAARNCLVALIDKPPSSSAHLEIPTRDSIIVATENRSGATNLQTEGNGLIPRREFGTSDLLMQSSRDDAGPVENGIMSPEVEAANEPVRRIVVRSPFDETAGIAPPSVEQERIFRRQTPRPLSILKPAQGTQENNAMTPATTRGRKEKITASSKPRGRSMPPLRSRNRKIESCVADKEGDSQMDDLMSGIRLGLSLQQGQGGATKLKRTTTPVPEGERPAKLQKTSRGIFGTLELEVGDLKSSYFPMRPQSRPGLADGIASNGPSMVPITKAKPMPRYSAGKITRQPSAKGRSRNITKTYSKKPQETETTVGK